MAELLAPLGYAPAAGPDGADLVILNTCHIREKAAEKVFSELGTIRRLKTARERARRPDGDRRRRLRRAGRGRGNPGARAVRRSRVRPAGLSPPARDAGRRPSAAAVRCSIRAFPPSRNSTICRAPDGAASGVTAFLTVQEGCDKFCTFCVVPYTRGAEYSRPADAVIAEARRLVANGAREITLLGQNVNAYHGAAVPTMAASGGSAS